MHLSIFPLLKKKMIIYMMSFYKFNSIIQASAKPSCSSVFTSEAGLGTGVVNQQSGQEAQHVFPVDLVGFQNLLQVTQQQLHTEEHSQLKKKQRHTDESLFRSFTSPQTQ